MYTTTRQHINETKSVLKREVGRAGGIQFEISLCSAVSPPPSFPLHAHYV